MTLKNLTTLTKITFSTTLTTSSRFDGQYTSALLYSLPAPLFPPLLHPHVPPTNAISPNWMWPETVARHVTINLPNMQPSPPHLHCIMFIFQYASYCCLPKVTSWVNLLLKTDQSSSWYLYVNPCHLIQRLSRSWPSKRHPKHPCCRAIIVWLAIVINDWYRFNCRMKLEYNYYGKIYGVNLKVNH